MKFRVAVDSNNLVIVVQADSGQTGKFHEVGTWCNFTIDSFPPIPANILQAKISAPIYKVENNTVVVRTLEEIQTPYTPVIISK